jgi:hypothetical protein
MKKNLWIHENLSNRHRKISITSENTKYEVHVFWRRPVLIPLKLMQGVAIKIPPQLYDWLNLVDTSEYRQPIISRTFYRIRSSYSEIVTKLSQIGLHADLE